MTPPHAAPAARGVGFSLISMPRQVTANVEAVGGAVALPVRLRAARPENSASRGRWSRDS